MGTGGCAGRDRPWAAGDAVSVDCRGQTERVSSFRDEALTNTEVDQIIAEGPSQARAPHRIAHGQCPLRVPNRGASRPQCPQANDNLQSQSGVQGQRLFWTREWTGDQAAAEGLLRQCATRPTLVVLEHI